MPIKVKDTKQRVEEGGRDLPPGMMLDEEGTGEDILPLNGQQMNQQVQVVQSPTPILTIQDPLPIAMTLDPQNKAPPPTPIANLLDRGEQQEHSVTPILASYPVINLPITKEDKQDTWP